MFRQNKIRLKGIVGEELFAVIIVIILIFVFVFSTISIYNKYISGQQLLYAERVASSLAEKVYFENNGVIAESACQSIVNKYNLTDISVNITYFKDGIKGCGITNENSSVSKAVATLPLLVTDGTFYPAIITVEAGK